MPQSGLDPEFLVLDGDGMIIPASLFIKDKSGTVIYDNAAVEIRPDHNSCLETTTENTQYELWTAHKAMKTAWVKGKIPSRSAVTFAPSARLRKEHKDLPSVSEFGCSPSKVLNPDMTASVSRCQVDAQSTPYRCAGFHVHTTADQYCYEYEPDPENMVELFTKRIALCDATVGLVDVLMNHLAGWDEQSKVRRETLGYGKAGEFRIRMHERETWDGEYYEYMPIIEYRTLSPWPLSHPMWTWWAQSAVRHCMARASIKNVDRTLAMLPDRSEIVDAINTTNAESAFELWKSVFLSMTTENTLGGDAGRDALCGYTLVNLNEIISFGGHRFITDTHIHKGSWKSAWFRNGPVYSTGEGHRAHRIRVRRAEVCGRYGMEEKDYNALSYEEQVKYCANDSSLRHLHPSSYPKPNKLRSTKRYFYFPSGLASMCERLLHQDERWETISSKDDR